jgi:pyruvate carboxylase
MIAKFIVRAADRLSAIARLRAALDAFTVEGVATNIPLPAGSPPAGLYRPPDRWLESVFLPVSQPKEADMAHIEFLDETMRDGQQSLWGMRMQAGMALPVAPLIDRSGFRVIDLTGSSLFE